MAKYIIIWSKTLNIDLCFEPECIEWYSVEQRNIKKMLTTKIETPTAASIGLSPPCVYAQTDENGNASRIKSAITP